jgi:dolichol-phosphate mannosyltransferase
VRESLSVVVPVWNEQATIGQLVKDLDAELAPLVEHLEIIVIDDASTDRTPAILECLAAELRSLRVLRAERNAGHGASVLKGFAAATGDWIFHIDSDGQLVVADFGRLWRRRESADLVLGYRVRRRDPVHRLVLSRIVAACASLLVGRRLRDPNAPFKLLRRALWADLAVFVPPDTLAPSILLAAAAVRRGWRVEQVPVAHHPRAVGRSSLRAARLVAFSARGLGQLVRLRVRLR